MLSFLLATLSVVAYIYVDIHNLSIGGISANDLKVCIGALLITSILNLLRALVVLEFCYDKLAEEHYSNEEDEGV